MGGVFVKRGLFASYQILACVLPGYWSHRLFGTCPDCSPVLACEDGVGVDLTALSDLIAARSIKKSSSWGSLSTILTGIAAVAIGWIAGVRCSCGCDHRSRHSSCSATVVGRPALTLPVTSRLPAIEPLLPPRWASLPISEDSRSPSSSFAPSTQEDTVGVWKPRRR